MLGERGNADADDKGLAFSKERGRERIIKNQERIVALENEREELEEGTSI